MKIPSFYFPSTRNPFVISMAGAWGVWVLLFFSLAWRERLRLGHWPYFMDPGTIGAARFPIHDGLVGLTMLVVFVLAVSWSALVVIQALFTRPFRLWHAVVALVIAWLPLGIGLLADPGDVFGWFFD